jgi:hypothetical protein
MCGLSPSKSVWSAAVSLATRIIYALPKVGRSLAKSATSSRSPYAEDIIASCIVTPMKQRGGEN